MAQFFEILFNKEKLKQNIREAKRYFSDMFKQAKNDARAAGEEFRKTSDSFANSMREQKKWLRDLKEGDRLAKMAADRQSNFRRTINEALGAGMLRPSDFRGQKNRGRLTDMFNSGQLRADLNAYKQAATSAMSGVSKAVDKKNSAMSRLRDLWKQSGDHVDRYRKRLSEAEKFERGYFTRLRHQLITLATAYLSYHSLRNAAMGVFNAGRSKEENYFGMSTAFGNKGNVKDAYRMAQRKALSGTPFKKQDMIQAFTEMMEIGLNPTNSKNFNLFGNIAGSKGMNMADVAKDISSAVYGNSDILRKYGFTNRQIFSLDKMVNQRPDNRRNVIMQMLNGDQRFKNGMRDFAYSWQGMVNKMGNHWKFFLESIIGDPSDKHSLYSKIKDAFQLVINWFDRNQKRIQRFGIAIGEVLKWVLRQIVSFGRYVGNHLEKVISKTDGTVTDFRTKMMKMILWLELSKERVVRFFEKWGWAIKWVAYIWGATKIVNLMSKGIATILNPLMKVIGALRTMGGLLSSGGGVLAGLTRVAGLFGVILTAITGVGLLWEKMFPDTKNGVRTLPTPNSKGDIGNGLNKVRPDQIVSQGGKKFNYEKQGVTPAQFGYGMLSPLGGLAAVQDMKTKQVQHEKQIDSLNKEQQRIYAVKNGTVINPNKQQTSVAGRDFLADYNRQHGGGKDSITINMPNARILANNPKEFIQEMQKNIQQFGNQSGYSGNGGAIDLDSGVTTNF